MFHITSERRQLPAPGSMRSIGSVWLDRSLRQRILLYIFQIQDHHGLREGAVNHGVFVMIWMSLSSVRGYNAAAHVIRLDTRINVVQPMMLAPVPLKLALQVMLQMEDLRLHQGVGDVADRVLVRHQASFSYNFI
jgi:hypothetical protein